MNPHTQYLAANSRELSEWVEHHYGELGHKVELAKGENGECIGYVDSVTKAAIVVVMK